MKINSLPFQKVITDSTKKFVKIKTQDYLEQGAYKIVDQGQEYVCGFTNDEGNINFVDIPAIVFGDHTCVLKYIDFPFAIGADGAKVLLVDSEIADTKYVYFYLRTIQLPDAGYSRHFKFLKTRNIALPENKDDQTRIANLLNQVESLISKRQQSIQLLDELLKSTFLDMFGDPIANTKKWEIKPFTYFAKVDTTMTKEFDQYSDYPHIGIGNIEKETGKLYGYKLVKDENLTSGKYIFTPEHIIYSKIRPNLNKVALPNFHGLASADAYPILVDHNKTNKYFFTYVLRSASFLTFILQYCDRANIPKVNKKQLQLMKCINPPKPLQDEFASIVQQVEQTKVHYHNSLDELKNLFDSLSQRAFRGELNLSRMELSKEETISSGIEEPVTKSDSLSLKKINLEKVTNITDGEIFSYLSNEPMRIDGLVRKWHEDAGLESIHFEEVHFDSLKERLLQMLKEKKLVQTFEYTEVLLKTKS